MNITNRKFGGRFVDFEALYHRDNGRCKICRRKVKIDQAVLDHIIPATQLYVNVRPGGGHPDHPLYKDPINAQIAHHSCNASRGAYGPAQIRLFG